jgi:hypothetical protein
MAKFDSEYVQNKAERKNLQSVRVAGPLTHPISGSRGFSSGIKGPVTTNSPTVTARRVVGYPYVCKHFSIAKGMAAPDTPEALHKNPYAKPRRTIQYSLTMLRMG